MHCRCYTPIKRFISKTSIATDIGAQWPCYAVVGSSQRPGEEQRGQEQEHQEKEKREEVNISCGAFACETSLE